MACKCANFRSTESVPQHCDNVKAINCGLGFSGGFERP